MFVEFTNRYFLDDKCDRVLINTDNIVSIEPSRGVKPNETVIRCVGDRLFTVTHSIDDVIARLRPGAGSASSLLCHCRKRSGTKKNGDIDVCADCGKYP